MEYVNIHQKIRCKRRERRFKRRRKISSIIFGLSFILLLLTGFLIDDPKDYNMGYISHDIYQEQLKDIGGN